MNKIIWTTHRRYGFREIGYVNGKEVFIIERKNNWVTLRAGADVMSIGMKPYDTIKAAKEAAVNIQYELLNTDA